MKIWMVYYRRKLLSIKTFINLVFTKQKNSGIQRMQNNNEPQIYIVRFQRFGVSYDVSAGFGNVSVLWKYIPNFERANLFWVILTALLHVLIKMVSYHNQELGRVGLITGALANAVLRSMS